MAITGNPLTVGISGLLMAQRNISVVSHNVSNVNVEGYSRQRTDMLTNVPTFSGAGYVGNGGSVVNVYRAYDSFLQKQYVTNTGASDYYTTYSGYAAQMDNLLADENAGLTPVMESFFAANHGVASDPISIPAREVMLSESETMVNRFHILNARMNNLRDNVNVELQNIIPEINSIAIEIASLNESIAASPGRASGVLPNDLLDRRDQLIVNISKYVSVQTVEQASGAMNVYVGNGQALVTNFDSQQLTIEANQYDTSVLEVGYQLGNNTVNISSLIKGGRLGALLDLRSNVIDPVQNSLGRIALSLSDVYNTQHRLGVDLNGDLGLDYFSVAGPEVFPNLNNAGAATITATITDTNLLTNSDYLLNFTAGNYSLIRQSDGVVVGGPGALPFLNVDGIDFTGVGVPLNGDSFLIRPTRQGARTLDLLMDNTFRIAAAAPIRTENDLANVGNGDLEVTAVTDTTGVEFTTTVRALTPPLMIEFDPTWTPAAGYPINYIVYDNTVPGAPVALTGPIAYDPTTSPVTGADVIASAGLPYGYEVSITKEPGPQDRFYVGYNTGATGDSFNMRQLAALQGSRDMLNSTATHMEAYGSMISMVGTTAHQSALAVKAHDTLLNQSIAAREAVSGVNLDEEAANMLKFEQAYQAASQVIVSAQRMFDTLIAAARG